MHLPSTFSRGGGGPGHTWGKCGDFCLTVETGNVFLLAGQWWWIKLETVFSSCNLICFAKASIYSFVVLLLFLPTLGCIAWSFTRFIEMQIMFISILNVRCLFVCSLSLSIQCFFLSLIFTILRIRFVAAKENVHVGLYAVQYLVQSSISCQVIGPGLFQDETESRNCWDQSIF